tara:strand:+ start:1240 stop:1434 length:195 start_codon:yes stop_codon:yes gene_type:complete
MMKEQEQLEEWQRIGMRILADPHASRSEVDTAIIGVRGSDNEWLKEQLQRKREKAWKAKNVKDN